MISRDEQWGDRYVTALRRRRTPAISLADAEAAATLAPHLAFDTIVFDVADDSDWDGCRRLKASPATASVPLIAVAGGGDPHSLAQAAREIGCCACIPKPTSLAVVLEVMQRVSRTHEPRPATGRVSA